MNIEFVEETSSTNDVLLKKGHEGWCEDTVLVAFRQSGGKGRNGRSFFSPARSGLYMSILLHPIVQMEDAFKITTLMAVAASEAIEECTGVNVDIKWVNDLYISGKKISGILTECSPAIRNGVPDYIVTGIGINLYEPDGGFPQDIKDRAGAVFSESVNSIADDELITIKKKIAQKIVWYFEKHYSTFPKVDYYEEYRKRSFLIGKKVRILDGDDVLVKSVNSDFGLVVEHGNGTLEVMRAGEVSLVL